MKWSYFYENCEEWAESTKLSRISMIEDLQNAKVKEIIDCIEYRCGDKAGKRLLRKALQEGVVFTPKEYFAITAIIYDDELTQEVLQHTKGRFSQGQIDELTYAVDDRLVSKLAVSSGLPDPFAKDTGKQQEAKKKRKSSNKQKGLMSLAAIFGISLGISGSRRDNTSFRIGDHVRVKYSGMEGTIIDRNGSLYMVSMKGGQKVESYPASGLERAW